jgi:hypothetical protein
VPDSSEFYGETNGSVIEYQSRIDKSMVTGGLDFYGNGGGLSERTYQTDSNVNGANKRANFQHPSDKTGAIPF